MSATKINEYCQKPERERERERERRERERERERERQRIKQRLQIVSDPIGKMKACRTQVQFFSFSFLFMFSSTGGQKSKDSPKTLCPTAHPNKSRVTTCTANRFTKRTFLNCNHGGPSLKELHAVVCKKTNPTIGLTLPPICIINF